MAADLLRKYVNRSVIICYRSVVKHPFLVGMIIVLFSMYRLFPLLFSILLSVSPVIISTFVLLGTLLSFGHPNIPEIDSKSDLDQEEIRNQKLESKVTSDTEIIGRDGNLGFEEITQIRPVNLVEDDGVVQFGEERLMNNEKVVLGSHYTPIRQSEDGDIVLETDDKLWEGSADPLNSDPNLLWKRVEGNNDEDDDDDDDDDGDEGSDSGDSGDSGSDMAESSSPDASMADIIPMLDELHPLLSEEQESREVPNIIDPVSEHSLGSSDNSSDSNDDNGGNENNYEDKETKNVDKEDEIRAAIRWTEYDQKNLMNLGTSEMERNRRLENLILRRRARKTMRMQGEKNLIDLESADIPFNIPLISTARNNPFDYDSNDNIPGSAPSVMLQRRNPFDLPYDSSEEKPDLVGDTFQQEFAVGQPKEPFFRRHESFNVGPSIFGASRSERQETKLRPYFVPERSFADFQRQFSGLSDSKVSSVPDTESVSSVGDLENKDNIEEDEHILEEELVSEKDLEHVSESDGRPYFLPEQVALFQVSDSKVSSVHDTESVSSDLENKDHIEEDDQILEAELVSEKDPENGFEGDIRPYFLSEHVSSDETRFLSFQRQLSEVSNSKISSVNDTDSVSSADDLENKDLIDLSREPDLITLEDRENESEIRERVFEHDGIVDPIQVHLNLGDRELHKSVSSLSSSDEVSEQIYNAKESDEVATSVSETSDYFVDRVNLIETSEIGITSLVVEESQPKEPIYDLSPRSVTRNLSSSSILHDLHKDESFQHIDDHNQPSSSVVDVKLNSTDSSPETGDAQNQLPAVTNTEEHLFAGDNISSSLPNMPLLVTDDVLLDIDAYHQLEQAQIPSSSSHERSHEDFHHEEVISQLDDAEFGRSLDKILAEDPEELQGHEELEYSESQFSEVVHGETYENPSKEEATLKEFSLLDTSVNKSAEENPEVLQVQIANNSDNLQMQEPENNVSLNINSVSRAKPDMIEVADIETKAPESPTYASDTHSIENNYVFDNIDDIDEIDEELLAELDAVGDFSVSDLESSLNEMQEDPHDLETRPTVNKDSYSENLGSIMSEMKEDSLVSEHDLEKNHSVNEDSYSRDVGSSFDVMMTQKTRGLENDIESKRFEDEDSDSKYLGSTLNEMTQGSCGLEHDIETKLPGDEDSYSKDLGSTLDVMKQDPRTSDDDLETKQSGDEDSYSKDVDEIKQDSNASEHDLETKLSGDEDSYSKDLGSNVDEMKQDPCASNDDLETKHSGDEDSYSDLEEMKQDSHASKHDLETKLPGDEDFYSKDLGSTLDEMKQDPRGSDDDLETKPSGEDSYSKDLDEIKQDSNASEHDLETKLSGDEGSYSKDLGSTLDEIKQDPNEFGHDLETNRSVDEDSYSKNLEVTFTEMKHDPQESDHNLETKHTGDKDSFSNDLELTLNEMNYEPDASEHDLESKCAGDEDSFSNDLELPLDEMKHDPDASEHDLEAKLSGDEDSYSKDLESTFNEIRPVPPVSEHRLETFYSVDENFYSKHVESTLNRINQQVTDQDLETNASGQTKVAGVSEDSALKLTIDASDVELAQQTESATSLTSSTSAPMVNHGTENGSTTCSTDKE